jgi:hypothetical protein
VNAMGWLVNQHPKLSRMLWGGGVCLLIASTALADDIYRYYDETNKVVYGSSVPAAFAHKGYAILNERGIVVKEVPPAPTAAQRALRQKELEAQAASEELKKKQQEADSLLVRLYRSPEEIERKRDARVEQIDLAISIANTGITKAKEALAAAQQVVNAAKKSNAEPAADVVKQAMNAERDINEQELNISRLQHEKAEVVTGAKQEIARLKELLGLPK